MWMLKALEILVKAIAVVKALKPTSFFQSKAKGNEQKEKIE